MVKSHADAAKQADEKLAETWIGGRALLQLSKLRQQSRGK